MQPSQLGVLGVRYQYHIFQEFLLLSKHNISILHSGVGKFKEYEDFKKVLELK